MYEPLTVRLQPLKFIATAQRRCRLALVPVDFDGPP